MISGRLGSIRDFLLLFFFIDLGSDIELSAIGEQLVPGLILSFFVLIGNPLIVMIIMGIMGYRKRVSFLAGLTVAQISEFSLILASLGLDNGHINEEVMGLITLVGLITISLSTYMILYSGPIFWRIEPLLHIFEKKHPVKEKQEQAVSGIDYIVIGIGRYGNKLARGLLHKGFAVMIVDFDPDIVENWQKEGLHAAYGDAEDPALPALLPLKQTKCIISTVPDLDSNIRLLRFMHESGFERKIAIAAHSDKEERALKKNGADYVLRPFNDAAAVEIEKISSSSR